MQANILDAVVFATRHAMCSCQALLSIRQALTSETSALHFVYWKTSVYLIIITQHRTALLKMTIYPKKQNRLVKPQVIGLGTQASQMMSKSDQENMCETMLNIVPAPPLINISILNSENAINRPETSQLKQSNKFYETFGPLMQLEPSYFHRLP
jgi:hypothetical protein